MRPSRGGCQPGVGGGHGAPAEGLWSCTESAGEGGGSGGTVDSTVSTSALTIWAAVVAGAAILLLVVTDHRQPARRRAPIPRADGRPPAVRRPDQVQDVAYRPSHLYRRPNPLLKVRSIAGAGALGAVVGALMALVVAIALIGLALLLERAVT